MCIIVGMSPYNYCAEAKKTEGSLCSNVTVLITDLSYRFCLGIPMKYNDGNKNDDTVVMSEYVIISYFLCPKVDVDVSTLREV